MTARLTREEYEDQRRRLSADAESARKALNLARANYDRITGELRLLRITWNEQQRTEAEETS